MNPQGYENFANVPAHAGGHQARRENFGVRVRGGPGPACAFPAPMPHRVYCNPAAFHRTCGQPYHNLTVAYGQSRPSDRSY